MLDLNTWTNATKDTWVKGHLRSSGVTKCQK